jgi:hypothetical protein
MDSEDMLDDLILKGFVEVAGIDPRNGEMLYSFTNAAKQSIPEISNRFEEEFHKDIMFFWENGIVEMNVFETNPTIRITEKAFDEGVLSSLSRDQIHSLQIIVQALRIE